MPLARSRLPFLLLYAAIVVVASGALLRAADDLHGRASEALLRAARFFNEHVSTDGGYLWRYSADLKLREGEGEVGPSTVWVQPPGTPAVGLSLLEAYDATGDAYYLAAARKTGDVLVRGQLRSGGWQASIELDPAVRRDWDFRIDKQRKGATFGKGRGMTSLDDNKSQSAMRFMMRLDKALGFKDSVIHEATLYALDHLVAAQRPNGAYPQVFEGPGDPKQFPVLAASYPKTWPRTYPGGDYWHFYTFNDNAMADCIDVLIEATRTYGDEEYLASAKRCGDFLLMSQMPEPQPAWAQQYNFEMHPVWARKFEPAAISGGESQGVIRMLMGLYRETGDRKYLEPIPRALAYLKRSLLPNGQLARFYELETNKPLYFTKDYKLTYSDADMPTHYGFKVGAKLDELEREYQRLATSPQPSAAGEPPRRARKPSAGEIQRVEDIIAALDDRGAWVEEGGMKYVRAGKDAPVISCQTFNNNVAALCEYLRATTASSGANSVSRGAAN